MSEHRLAVFKMPRAYYERAFGTINEEQEPSELGRKDLEWFAGYKNTYSEELQTLPDFHPNQDEDTLATYFRSVFPPEMQSRMKLVGRGMEKVVFVFNSGVAFKFQYQTKLGNQMKNEIAESLRWPGMQCFPRLFSWADDGLCLACECAEPPTRKDFLELAGMTPYQISNSAHDYAATRRCALKDALDSGKIKGKTADSLYDLLAFSAELHRRTKHALLDIAGEHNWGLTTRDGEKVLIVTDYGL